MQNHDSTLSRALASLWRAVESYVGRFLLFILGMFAVVLLIDLHGPNDFPSWLFSGELGDSLAAWIEALATVGAFIAALVAVRHSWKLFEAERASRLELEQAAERAAQADGVAAWISSAGQTRLRNSGDLPIYDVAVAWVSGADRRGIDVGTWPPTFEDEVHFPFEAGLQDEASGEIVHWENPRTYQVLIRFRDTAGRIWQRDQFGELAPPKRMTYAIPSDKGALSVSEIVANSQADAPGPT